MEPVIASALIGGVSTVVAAAITYGLTRTSEFRPRISLPQQRSKALAGHWTGKMIKDNHKSGTPRVYDLGVNLRTRGGRIHGEATSRAARKKVIQPLALTGRFFDNRYVRIDYKASDGRILEFGSFLAELDSEATVLTGLFVGYGRRTGDVISGKITLNKNPQKDYATKRSSVH